MNKTFLKQCATVTLMALIAVGCSSNPQKQAANAKSKEDRVAKKAAKKAAKPADLVKFTQTLQLQKVWRADVGRGERLLGVQQAPAIADNKVFAAGTEDTVFAFDLLTGKKIWQFKAEKPEKVKGKKAAPLRLSGGPGVGEGAVAVGSLSGEVILLDAATGAKRWQVKVPNEVIAAPAIADGLVLVRTNDGRVTALDIQNGERRWFNTQDLPTLTVRGNAPIVLGPGIVFVGNDDGTLSALAIQDGRPLWEQAVGVPEGRTELERMSDVDAAPVIDGSLVLATSAKNETVAIDGPSGQVLWTEKHGGSHGLAVGPQHVIVADQAGTVWALDKKTGATLWSQPALARRSLSGAAIQGNYAVVGDYDGYLHWMNLTDGSFSARLRAGGEAVRGQPQVVGDLLIVQTIEGGLSAFRLP